MIKIIKILLITAAIFLIVNVVSINCQREVEVLEQQLIQAIRENPQRQADIVQSIRNLPLRVKYILYRTFPNLAMFLIPN